MSIQKLVPPPSGRKAAAPIALTVPVLAAAPASPSFTKFDRPDPAARPTFASPTGRLGALPRSTAGPPAGFDDVETPSAQGRVDAKTPVREPTFQEKYPDGYGSSYKPKTRYGADGKALPTLANPEADEIPY